MEDLDQQWRNKIRLICDVALGGFAEKVYREIEDAVEARIEQARTEGWNSGMEQGSSPCCHE